MVGESEIAGGIEKHELSKRKSIASMSVAKTLLVSVGCRNIVC
jgi:hypothetical protein